MPTGTGLDAQIGWKAEATYGTAETVDQFTEFNSEELQMEPSWLEPTGLRAGLKYQREKRVRISRKDVNGSVTLEHATKGMGILWDQALGQSTTSQPDATNAPSVYEHIFTPGDKVGKSMTVQVGRPEPEGTVQPFTYTGMKVTEWEFSLEDEETPTLELTFSGRDEDTETALATASYVADSGVFAFPQAELKIGGTPDTTDGKTTVSGGSVVSTVITEISIAGETPMADERFGVGNTGLRSEPLENDTPTISGSLTAEFNKSELYDLFANEDTTTLELTFTGENIEAEFDDTLSFILPAVKLQTAAPQVEGPEVVSMETEFKAYTNEVDPVAQVRIVSTDSTI